MLGGRSPFLNDDKLSQVCEKEICHASPSIHSRARQESTKQECDGSESVEFALQKSFSDRLQNEKPQKRSHARFETLHMQLSRAPQTANKAGKGAAERSRMGWQGTKKATDGAAGAFARSDENKKE